MTFQITAPPKKIAALIDSLKNVWPHCQGAALSVADSSGSYTVEIPYVQHEQIAALAAEDNREILDHLAGQYARANEKKDTLFAKEDTSELQDIGIGEYPRLAMPILTGTDDSTSKKPISTQPMIRLWIQIERSVE